MSFFSLERNKDRSGENLPRSRRLPGIQRSGIFTSSDICVTPVSRLTVSFVFSTTPAVKSVVDRASSPISDAAQASFMTLPIDRINVPQPLRGN